MTAHRKTVLGLALLALLAGCMAPPIRRETVEPAPPSTAAEGRRYLLYKPRGYDDPEHAGKRWPLLVYLRGRPTMGRTISDMTRNGPTEEVERGMEIPFLMVSPHANQIDDRKLWPTDLVHATIDHAIATERVDEERIYLTGISVGAEAVWRVAAARPRRFAALVPVCGYADAADIRQLPHMPVWIFHGGIDFVTLPRGAYDMVRTHREVGGDPRFTMYPMQWHYVWKKVYKRRDLYAWLLDQRRQLEEAPRGG